MLMSDFHMFGCTPYQLLLLNRSLPEQHTQQFTRYLSQPLAQQLAQHLNQQRAQHLAQQPAQQLSYHFASSIVPFWFGYQTSSSRNLYSPTQRLHLADVSHQYPSLQIPKYKVKLRTCSGESKCKIAPGEPYQIFWKLSQTSNKFGSYARNPTCRKFKGKL